MQIAKCVVVKIRLGSLGQLQGSEKVYSSTLRLAFSLGQLWQTNKATVRDPK